MSTTSLTERELEVLEQLTQGLRNKELADTLDISENTVESHLRSIFGKIGARNRGEAIVWSMLNQTGLNQTGQNQSGQNQQPQITSTQIKSTQYKKR